MLTRRYNKKEEERVIVRSTGYGYPIATESTYGDDVFCLHCAAFIYTRMGERKGNDFFFWVRDLNTQKMHDVIGGDEIDAFIEEFKYKGIRDALSEDTSSRIRLLCEGQDQKIIADHGHCKKCLVDLQDLCRDYREVDESPVEENPAHDGNLDENEDGHIHATVELKSTGHPVYIRIFSWGKYITLNPAQALSLLTWLDQNRAMLETLASKEEEEEDATKKS